MKTCQEHWGMLKKQLNEAGLMKFVANDGVQAADRIRNQIQGDSSNENYDPLMASYFAILSNLIESFGVNAFADDAPPCLLCYMNECAKNGCGNPECKEHHHSGDEWIALAVRDQISEAQKRGLLSDMVN